MMNRRPEPIERGKMLGHAVTHMPLEAVTWVRGTETSHQAIARHFGDNRRRRNGGDEAVAADHGLAVATALDTIATVDKYEVRPDRQRGNRPRQRP